MDVDVEADLERLRADGRLHDLATLAIETYGPGVLGYLTTILRDHAEASEAFAQACENLWRGLPRFEGRSMVKTWFYTLARNAGLRLRSTSKDRRHVPLSEVSELVESVRSRTAVHLRSQVKSKVAEIRDELEEADCTLLVLRVDRAMSWNEVARVIEEGELGDDELVRAAARLRQRFQVIKQIIHDRARERGLLDEWLEADA